jgi:hypothetical protein
VKLPRGIAEVGLTVGATGYALKMTRVRIPREVDPPPDTNKITLIASGGSLALDLKLPGGAPDKSITAYLVHDGAIEYAGRLAGWDTDQPSSGGDEQVVETIEPGVYTLCLVSDSAELAKIWAGALPPEHCTAGSIELGRTLTLTPK